MPKKYFVNYLQKVGVASLGDDFGENVFSMSPKSRSSYAERHYHYFDTPEAS